MVLTLPSYFSMPNTHENAKTGKKEGHTRWFVYDRSGVYHLGTYVIHYFLCSFFLFPLLFPPSLNIKSELNSYKHKYEKDINGHR